MHCIFVQKIIIFGKKMSMKKYVKKPVVIEAVQYLTDNHEEVRAFMGTYPFIYEAQEQTISIHTLEGDLIVKHGDYVIKGIAGEFYPCKPDIFKDSYTEIPSN